jgi:DNA-binding response OmpR family regulator
VAARRILLSGAAGDPALGRLAGRLADEGWEVIESESPGEIDFSLGAQRIGACVFDAARYESLFLGRMRRRHAGRTWVAWTPGYSSTRTAELLAAGAAEVLNGAMSDAELLARLLRVGETRREGAGLETGGLRIDGESGVVSWDGVELPLTAREREVLEVLARAAGKTVRREVVYREVWGFSMARGDRTVDVNVKRLRAKLAAASAGVRIVTHPGIGYRLEVEEPVPALAPLVTGL